MHKKLLFVHIPKTAGTSFKVAAKKYFTEKNIFLDYGIDSSETSNEILECVYKKQDMYMLHKVFSKYKNFFLAGHFSVNKYMGLFDTVNVITFVREPVGQVVSHYKHYCRDLKYKDDLKTFIKDKKFKNMQSRLLGAKPLELFGFIGLTEEYALSIDLINEYYHCDFEVLNENMSSQKGSLDIVLDEETIALIKKENAKDMAMYEKAKHIFKERVQAFKEKRPQAHLLIQEETESIFRGCAFSKTIKTPINLEIYIKGKKVMTLSAKSWRPGLLAQGVPRKGFIGFEYSLKDFSNEEKKSLSVKVIL